MNFAIVGCGHIAKKHAQAIEQVPGSTLYAVCDTIEINMRPYIENYNAVGFTSLDDLLKDENVDVINICTPSGYHADIAVKVANAKKHIIVEKPIALTIKDADRIIQACKINNVKLAVVHPNRFRPVMIKLKEVLDKKMLGKISHVNATVRWNRNQDYYDQAPWRGTKSLDGGVLMNQAIHNLDLMLWFTGQPHEVFGMSATRLREIESEDVATGIVRFENGALGLVEAAVTIYPQNLEETISIFGENGSIKIGGKTATLIEHWNVKNMDDEETSQIIGEIKSDPMGKPGHQHIIEDMIVAIEKDRDPIVNGDDGKNALELVLKLYESFESEEKVNYKKTKENLHD